MVGPVTNSAVGCVNQSFSFNVFGSSATIAFAFPSPLVWPGPIAATSVLSELNATAPITPPPLVFHDTPGFASLSRSMAHTAAGAPPQSRDVAAYSVVFTPTGADHRALAGRNAAGRWMSLPEGRPTTCSMPSLEIR